MRYKGWGPRLEWEQRKSKLLCVREMQAGIGGRGEGDRERTRGRRRRWVKGTG